MNRAYRTLLSPMERIGYVLGRNGKEVGEAEQMEDMGLIVEVMEAREAIERSAGEELGQLTAANDGKWQAVVSSRAETLFAGKMEGALGMIEDAVGREDWASAKRWAVRLKYLLTIRDAIQHRAENAE